MSKSKPGFSLIFASVFAFVFQLIFPLFIGYGTVLAAPEPPEIAADSYLLAEDVYKRQIQAGLILLMKRK